MIEKAAPSFLENWDALGDHLARDRLNINSSNDRLCLGTSVPASTGGAHPCASIGACCLMEFSYVVSIPSQLDSYCRKAHNTLKNALSRIDTLRSAPTALRADDIVPFLPGYDLNPVMSSPPPQPQIQEQAQIESNRKLDLVLDTLAGIQNTLAASPTSSAPLSSITVELQSLADATISPHDDDNPLHKLNELSTCTPYVRRYFDALNSLVEEFPNSVLGVHPEFPFRICTFCGSPGHGSTKSCPVFRGKFGYNDRDPREVLAEHLFKVLNGTASGVRNLLDYVSHIGQHIHDGVNSIVVNNNRLPIPLEVNQKLLAKRLNKIGDKRFPSILLGFGHLASGGPVLNYFIKHYATHDFASRILQIFHVDTYRLFCEALSKHKSLAGRFDLSTMIYYVEMTAGTGKDPLELSNTADDLMTRCDFIRSTIVPFEMSAREQSTQQGLQAMLEYMPQPTSEIPTIPNDELAFMDANPQTWLYHPEEYIHPDTPTSYTF